MRFDHDLHFVRHQLWQLSATLAEEAENKTQLKWRQRFSSREHFEQVRSFVAEANEQVLDRLEAELARM